MKANKLLFPQKTVWLSALMLMMVVSITAQDYTWQRVKIGAGGWVTGMDIHQNGRYAYCRTDVGGAYRLDLQNNNSEWVQLVSVTSMPSDKVALGSAFVPDETRNFKGVASMVSAPSDDTRVYMMYNRILYRSDNRGDTWQPTSLDIETFANESNVDSKLIGERIVVDPVNKNVVYYGSNNNGLYRTLNGGDTWTKVNSIPNGEALFGIAGIAVDVSSETVNGKKAVVYVGVYNAGIYRSTNGGETWAKIPGAPADSEISDTDIGVDGTFYYTTATGGIFRFANGNWTSLPSPSGQLADVSVDPLNANNVLVTNASGTIYSSTNQGANGWVATDDEKSITATDIPWLAYADDEDFLSIGEIVHDPKINGRIWMSNGTGVYFSDYGMNGGRVDWFSRNVGIEELICKDIIKAPGQKLVQLSMDRPIFVIEDENEFPVRHFPDDKFQSAWDGDYCAAQPEFMAVIMTNENFFKEHEASGWSDDGGRTWNRFASMPDWPGKKEQNLLEQGFGSIAVSSTNTNNILMNNAALFTGIPESQQNLTNLYYTTDRGASWEKSQGVPEKNGFPVRYHNRKNICSDAIAPNTFYFYHWIEGGLFKSTDQGQSFTKVNSTIPSGAYHPRIKPVFGKEGHLLWSEGFDGRSPLLLSTDGGRTFASISGDNVVYDFGLGKALNDYPTIFVQGRFNGQDGYYRSTDQGATWQQIGTFPLDTYGTIGGIDGDKEIFGKVYIGTEAFGVFSGTSGDVQNIPVESIELSPTTAELEVGKTVQLNKTVNPNNATNKAVTWSSSDTEIATVDANGKVSGISEGNAVITVLTQEGNKTATATITVLEETTGGTGDNFGFETGNFSGWNTSGSPGIETWASRTGTYGAVLTSATDELRKEFGELSPNTIYEVTVWTYIDGTAGGSLSVSVSGFGGNAVSSNVDATLSWSKTTLEFVTDATASAAQLSLQASAMPSGWIWLDDISIRSKGSTEILPTSIAVTPEAAELIPGSTLALEVVVSPANATDTSVTFTSTDTTVATVDVAGIVTALSPGTAFIQVETVAGTAATSVAISVVAENSDNLIKNPGFERNPAMADWGAFNAVARATNKKTGQFGVRMGGNATTDGYLSQIVAELKSNTTYTLRFWSKMNEGNVMFAGINRSGDDQQLRLSNTAWSENVLTFTTGSNNTEAEVYIWIDSGQRGFADDFELTEGASETITGKETQTTSMMLYPNSARGDFTVSLGSTTKQRSVRIFNFQGALVYQTATSEVQIVLNTTQLGLAPGMYVVSVADGSTKETKKLVVE